MSLFKSLFRGYMRMYRAGGYYKTDNQHGCLTPKGHLDAYVVFGDPEKYRKCQDMQK